MAVEYDKWTDARALSEDTAAEIQEIIGDAFEVTYSASDGTMMIKKDDNNRLGFLKYLWEKGNRIQWASDTCPYIKYYAKRSGEILISSLYTGNSCVQVAIGKCSDGSSGLIAIGKRQASSYFDSAFLYGDNMPPYTMVHNITNYEMPNKLYLSIRKAVLHSDVTFDNIYINNYGYTDAFTIIEMNGERYACANGTTGNHVCLLMKL